MKGKIAITGSKGTIGSVLKKGLSDEYQITEVDLPQTDVRNYEELIRVLPNNSAVIHLAWDNSERFGENNLNPSNLQMYFNVYKAALELGVKRVIMASSIHADSFYGHKGEPMSPNRVAVPDSIYGMDKVFMESMGRYFAKKGLEVVLIRFGGINPKNTPPSEDFPIEERGAWLSHEDCVSLIRTVLEAQKIPDNFVILYAISDNKNTVQDMSNPFGWKPQNRL